MRARRAGRPASPSTGATGAAARGRLQPVARCTVVSKTDCGMGLSNLDEHRYAWPSMWAYIARAGAGLLHHGLKTLNECLWLIATPAGNVRGHVVQSKQTGAAHAVVRGNGDAKTSNVSASPAPFPHPGANVLAGLQLVALRFFPGGAAGVCGDVCGAP